MLFIVDGIVYDEYPDDRERIWSLRESRNGALDLATEFLKRAWKAEDRNEKLEATILDLQVMIADLEVQLEACKNGMGA